MSNKKPVIIILAIIISIAAIISILIIGRNSEPINNLRYDILVEQHRHEYENMDPSMIPENGHSTRYYYAFVNSERKEKYTIVYTNVFEVHNMRGELDSVEIYTEKIGDEELQKYIDEYGKNDKMLSLKAILNKNIKEKYTINFNN